MHRWPVALALFSTVAWGSCDIPSKQLEANFRQLWDEEGKVSREHIEVDGAHFAILNHESSCGLRGCEYSFYRLEANCAYEALVVAGSLSWNEEHTKLTVRRRPSPVDDEAKPVRTFSYSAEKKDFLEEK